MLWMTHSSARRWNSSSLKTLCFSLSKPGLYWHGCASPVRPAPPWHAYQKGATHLGKHWDKLTPERPTKELQTLHSFFRYSQELWGERGIPSSLLCLWHGSPSIPHWPVSEGGCALGAAPFCLPFVQPQKQVQGHEHRGGCFLQCEDR